MRFPEIINYLLTLRYPGSTVEKQGWVCYRGFIQYIIPLVRPGQTVYYTVRPLQGVYAWLGYGMRFASEMVPNTFAVTVSQFGSRPFTGRVTEVIRGDDIEGFVLITDQEPMDISGTNLSSLAQRIEMIGTALMISTPQDMEVILDALRRLHTSTESEQLLQQAAYLLGILANQPVEPRPPVGGS